MMKLVRLMLMLTVLLAVYTAVLPALVIPQLWFLYLFVLIVAGFKKGQTALSSHGTARWADVTDLGGMVDGE